MRNWQQGLTNFSSDMLSASCAPTTTTFSTLIQACGKARLDTKLLEIYEQMKDYDLKPNDEVPVAPVAAWTHSAASGVRLNDHGLWASGQLRRGAPLLLRGGTSWASAERIDLRSHHYCGVSNDLGGLSVLTRNSSGLCNNMDKALGFFQEMQVLEMKLGPVAYEAIIRAALRCYRADIASKRPVFFRPSSPSESLCYSYYTITSATYYQRMVSERIPPNTGLKGEIDAALSGQPRHGAGQAHVQPRSGGS